MTQEAADASSNAPDYLGRRIEPGSHPTTRPRDAASLILIDRSGDAFRVLLGKRAGRHAFMPNTYVFPGGRRDRGDSHAPVANDLQPSVAGKLMLRTSAASPTRARALAVAALRETCEEAGLVVGRSDPASQGYDLSTLRYVARAVTPPGRSRRYDTRFFASFCDEAEVAATDIAESDELSDLRWVPLADLPDLPLPRITAVILAHLRDELLRDPDLPHGRPVPFFFGRRGVFAQEIL